VVTRRGRRGASAIGCLGSLVVVAVVAYYGINLGRIWWRYWEIKERMGTAVRYAFTQADSQVQAQLRADAREIGLPLDGLRFRIERLQAPASVVISTRYRETVDLPLLRRELEFAPRVSLRR
jgi:hypothetical protein